MKTSPLLILFALLFACNVNDLSFDNIKGPVLTGDVALILGEAEYTMREMIADIGDNAMDLREDSNSLLVLYYFDSAEFESATDVIDVPDFINSSIMDMPELEAQASVRQEVVQDTLTFNYVAKNGELLDSIFYTAGTLSLSVKSNVPSDMNYSLTVANTVKSDTKEPVVFKGSLRANGTSTNQQNLANYQTYLTARGDSNIFKVAVKLTLFLEAGQTTSSGNNVELSLTYSDQEFSLLYGQFGRDTLEVGNEVLSVPFFDDLGQSGMKFGDPTITFNFKNTFGLPLGVKFNEMYALDSANGSANKVYLTGAAANNPQTVLASESPNLEKSSSVVINKNNSSIVDFLATTPNTIGFNITAITNPLDITAKNFVMNDSKISTTIEVKLPMTLALKNVTRDLDFDLGAGLKFDEAEELTARVVSLNGLPFSALLEMHILNAGDTIIHSIPNSAILESPFLDDRGFVVTPKKYVADFTIDKEGIEALQVGNKLRLRIIINTPTTGGTREFYVKVLADYAIKLQVSLLGKLKAEL